MWELIFGAIIGTLTSVVIAEIYHRRAAREASLELDRRLKAVDDLYNNLDRQLQDAVYFSEQARDEARRSTEAAQDAKFRGIIMHP